MYTPEQNNGTNIFVFGSNLAGRHGRGAALEARKYWGAETGVGIGRTGQCYAIPTKDGHLQTRSLGEISFNVSQFIRYAKLHPELTFLLTKIGCGLAGYNEANIGPMFTHAPSNVIQPAWVLPNPRYPNLVHFKVPFVSDSAVDPKGLPRIFRGAWQVFCNGNNVPDSYPAETVERFMATIKRYADDMHELCNPIGISEEK